MKDIKHIRWDFHSVTWIMPQGWDLGGGDNLKVPVPWGGVKNSNIIKFQLQSQFQRILNQTLSVFSQIRRDLHPVAWIMPKGRDLKVHTGGQQCNFLNMVMCHTKLKGMTRRLGFTEKFYPWIKLGPIWATCIWANPYGTHAEPGCTPHIGMSCLAMKFCQYWHTSSPLEYRMKLYIIHVSWVYYLAPEELKISAHCSAE